MLKATTVQGVREKTGTAFHGPTLTRYCLTVAAVGFLSFGEPAEAAQFDFITDNGEMNNSSNWVLLFGSESDSPIPGEADTAFIDSGRTAILGDGSDMTIRRVSIGTFYGPGTMNILDGSLNVSYLFWLGEGESGGGGTVTVDGSSAAINVAPASSFFLGYSNTGKLTISNGGQVNSSVYVRLAERETGSGWLNINSGAVLQAPNIIEGDGNGTVNFDGGVLRLTGNQPILFNGFEAGDIILNAGGGFIDTNGYNATTFVGLQGTGGLTKQGAGTLTLAGTNTYSGATTVDAGTLSVSSDSNLGTGDLTLNGGNLAVTGATTIDNAIALSSSATVTNSADVTLSGVISGTGSLTKAGANTLTLSGTNTYSGTTTVDAGTLSVSSDSNLGTGALTLNGGNLAVTGATTIDNAIALSSNATVTNSADVILSGVISGAGELTKAGANTITLSGSNTYSGGTTISDGVLQVSADNQLGSGTLTLDGGTLRNTSFYTETNATILNTGTTSTIDAANTLAYTGVISGDGNLIKTGTGDLALMGNNTYTGTTTISAGLLQIGAGATSGAIIGDIINNAELIFFRSNDDTHAGDVSGTGLIRKFGSGTTTITGALSHTGGTIIGNGALEIGNGGTTGSINGSITNNRSLIFNRSDAVTFGDVISGTGSFTQAGTGNTNLTGTNTYSGATTINSGILSVNGSIANSTTTINAGGTLGGTGTVGSVNINGGTLAPGNSIGTLNVAGNVDFSAGGTYAVEVDAAGNSDKINATGTATLTNGTVAVLPEAGNYNLSTDYTILTAAGGLGGTTFNSVSSSLAFLTPTLSYDANNVFLNLRRNDVSFSAVAGTPNQTAVGTVIDELSTTNPDNIQDLLNNLFILTADGANQAYDSLSGVQHTHGNHIALQSINQFKGLLFDRIQGNNQFLAHDGKLMLAYNEAGTMSDAGASLIDRNVSPQRGWWVRGTGNYGEIEDTRNASGAHYKAGGVAAGIDLDLDGKLTLGGAFGYTRTDADVANGGLDVDSYQAALYGRLTLRDDYYLSGMTGVGFHDMKANRQVTVGLSSNTAEADYDAWTGNVAIEGGRKLTFNSNTSITPFAGLEYAHINRDSFTEKDGGVANLKVKQDKQDSLRSAIGARLTHSWITNGTRITPTAELAWIHEFMEDESGIRAGFATAPSATFSVDGPDLDRDRARLALGLNVQLSQTADLNLGYQGEYAGSDERHDIAATFRMFW